MKKSKEQLKYEAYQIGLKFINTRLEEEVLYAKIEKQGIPINIAKEVATNIVLQRNSNNKVNFSDYKKLGIYLSIFWIIGSTAAYAFTSEIFIGILFLISTVLPSSIIGYLMSTTKLKFS
ncbi:MAG: hypothetical protein HWD85_06725 [Flavobacteriaceae bacterium]|nr:hypothetical protein [Flavobacteriaceae bacterium]